MRKFVLIVMLCVISIVFAFAQVASAYDFGDFRSVTLVSKAWGVLAKNDLEAVLAYTNKCIELYAEQAQKMQNELKDYVVFDPNDPATKEKVFSYWALNDVATALYIQGEGYLKNNMKEEAKEVYRKVVENYTFGQAWDLQGWFWKPAEAAKDKLKIINSGLSIDYGNYSSSYLVGQAWKALNNNSLDAVVIYVDKLLEMYETKARDMQASLSAYPVEKEKVFSYWALNDVGTGLYIKGEVYKNSKMTQEAIETFQKLVDSFSYAQIWDPQGWFWKPAEVAQQRIAELMNP